MGAQTNTHNGCTDTHTVTQWVHKHTHTQNTSNTIGAQTHGITHTHSNTMDAQTHDIAHTHGIARTHTHTPRETPFCAVALSFRTLSNPFFFLSFT